ncbi:MAG: DUF2510 domain-containing protein [Jatrophihabitans sp.]|nr:MAG: DUF2510 domain-containing protein [Jatrophihabitans sp.]
MISGEGAGGRVNVPRRRGGTTVNVGYPGAPLLAAPPPGWYPDPTRQAKQRYWDGGQWTDHTN